MPFCKLNGAIRKKKTGFTRGNTEWVKRNTTDNEEDATLPNKKEVKCMKNFTRISQVGELMALRPVTKPLETATVLRPSKYSTNPSVASSSTHFVF